MSREIKRPAWDNFCDAMDFESDDRNFKHDFGMMTKKYGNAYIEFCKASWEANDEVMFEEEFMKMNADMPKDFFDRVIKT